MRATSVIVAILVALLVGCIGAPTENQGWNWCAVAPSGKAVVYQDTRSGLVFLFRLPDGKPVQLTTKFFGIIDEYDWHESEGVIRVVVDKYKSTRKERKLTIPK